MKSCGCLFRFQKHGFGKVVVFDFSHEESLKIAQRLSTLKWKACFLLLIICIRNSQHPLVQAWQGIRGWPKLSYIWIKRNIRHKHLSRALKVQLKGLINLKVLKSWKWTVFASKAQVTNTLCCRCCLCFVQSGHHSMVKWYRCADLSGWHSPVSM